jgi:DUF1365 family protein
VERVFHIFDKDDNGSISLQEFIDAMHQFAGQSPDDKIKFLFKVYDIDGKNRALFSCRSSKQMEKYTIYGPSSFFGKRSIVLLPSRGTLQAKKRGLPMATYSIMLYL